MLESLDLSVVHPLKKGKCLSSPEYKIGRSRVDISEGSLPWPLASHDAQEESVAEAVDADQLKSDEVGEQARG